MKVKEPTLTSLIVEVMKKRDDFITRKELFEALHLPGHRSAKQLQKSIYLDLLWLRERNVVDVVIQQGVSYWFLQPPENDTRIRVINEMAPHLKRRSKKQSTPKKEKQ